MERPGAAPGDLLLRREAFQIRLARTVQQAAVCDASDRKRYRRSGDRPGIQLPSLSTPGCLTLQVCGAQRAVFGTLEVCFDSHARLPAEALYRTEIDAWRAHAPGACQMTRLAIEPGHGSRELLGALFHVAYHIAGPLRQAAHVFIEVHPRHARFYRRMLGFRQVGAAKMCTRVQSVAVLMHLATAEAADQIARHAGRVSRDVRSLYPYFCAEAEVQQFARRLMTLEALS